MEGAGRRNDFETFTGRLRRDTGISLAVRLRAKQNKTKRFKKNKKGKEKAAQAGWRCNWEKEKVCSFRSRDESLQLAYAHVNFQE